MKTKEEKIEWLKNLPIEEKAKSMFLIKKKRKKLADEIEGVFDKISELYDNQFYKKSSTVLLEQVVSFLKIDSEYLFTKFSSAEYELSRKINYLNSIDVSGLKKHLTFLQSQSERNNRITINEISILFDKKNETIKKYYKDDIAIVNSFLKYATYKLKEKEVFFYITDYQNSSWVKKSFKKNLSNYFIYKLKLNPSNLDDKYIDDMKGYYSFVGLGIETKEKTDLANHYFRTNKNAFNFGLNSIPEKYNEVYSEINMVPIIMMQNENQLQEILEYSLEEYGK